MLIPIRLLKLAIEGNFNVNIASWESGSFKGTPKMITQNLRTMGHEPESQFPVVHSPLTGIGFHPCLIEQVFLVAKLEKASN